MHKVFVPVNYQYLRSIIPGVGLALVFCLFSQGINNVLAIEIFGTAKSPISTVLIAILLPHFLLIPQLQDNAQP